MKIYLASQSPRRKELLKILDFSFDVLDFPFDERAFELAFKETQPHFKPEQLTTALAEGKAQAAFQNRLNSGETDFLILAADTIVVLDDVIFGKGEDESHSIQMLKVLSGRSHHVMTAISVIDARCRQETRLVETEVCFAKLSDAEIKAYVETERPFDKAGAYGIQEKAATFVEGIHGDYYNVVGLPLRATHLLLKKFLET